VIAPGGRFVIGDLVVPEEPARATTPIDGVYDVPSRADEQMKWLADAGFRASLAWEHGDLAVLVGIRPTTTHHPASH
jgi:tRNA (cmo5U34)-methyltransferase